MQYIDLNKPDSVGKSDSDVDFIPEYSQLNMRMLGRCSIQYSWDIPHNHIGVGAVAISENGILIYGLRAVHTKTNTYYYFSGENGYIDAAYIDQAQIGRKRHIEALNIWLSHNRSMSICVGDYMIDFETLQMFADIFNSQKSQQPHVQAFGNLLDLGHDSTYAEDGEHIIARQLAYGFPNNLQQTSLVSIKSRYLPTYTNPIFKHCLHLYKHFILATNGQQLLIIQLKINNELYFFSGDVITLNLQDIVKTATYFVPPHRQRLILVTKMGLITLAAPAIGKTLFPRIADFSHLSNFIGDLNPIFLPKLQYRNFIKNEMDIIAVRHHVYNQAHHQKEHLAFPWDAKSFVHVFKWWIPVHGKRINIWSFMLPYIGAFIIWAIKANIPVPLHHSFWIFLFSSPVLVFLCLCAWNTFMRSQERTSKPATIVTAVVTVLILGIGGGTIGSLHHDEVSISNAEQQASFGNYNSRNVPVSEQSDEPNTPVASQVRATASSLSGVYKGKPFKFVITNYYHNFARDGLVLKGYYTGAGAHDWTSQWNKLDYSSQSGHTATGYSADNIFVIRKSNGLYINFSGDANDYSTKNDSYTATADSTHNAMLYPVQQNQRKPQRPKITRNHKPVKNK